MPPTLTSRRRSPQGERGLKLTGQSLMVEASSSLPARGARVEILAVVVAALVVKVAPRKGSEG